MLNPNFVFNTQAEAVNANAIIDALVRQRVTERSPECIDEGGIIGRRNGELYHAGPRTVTWAEPIQRLDGKWVFPIITDSYAPILEGIDFMGALSNYTIEDWQQEWFPPPVE